MSNINSQLSFHMDFVDRNPSSYQDSTGMSINYSRGDEDDK